MSIALWIVATVLALVFLAAGATKATKPKDELATTMPWVNDFSSNVVKLIGVLEILGALGLVLPAVTGVAPVLVPLAALGLRSRWRRRPSFTCAAVRSRCSRSTACCCWPLPSWPGDASGTTPSEPRRTRCRAG